MQDAHPVKSHQNKDQQKEQQICVSHSAHSKRDAHWVERQGHPCYLKCCFYLCFVFVEQVYLDPEKVEAGIYDMTDMP